MTDYPCGKYCIVSAILPQTHRQTRMNALLTRLSSASVIMLNNTFHCVCFAIFLIFFYYSTSLYTVWVKKKVTTLVHIASSNIDRFSKFFHRYAAFTLAQHVARQQVARTSNLLWATSNMLRATSCLLRATCCFKQLVAAQHVALV